MSGTASSQRNSEFCFLRNCQTLFHNSQPILHSRQQCVRMPGPPHPPQHFLSLFVSLFVLIIVLVSAKWRLIVLICVFLVISHVEHLFTRFLAICIFFGEIPI